MIKKKLEFVIFRPEITCGKPRNLDCSQSPIFPGIVVATAPISLSHTAAWSLDESENWGEYKMPVVRGRGGENVTASLCLVCYFGLSRDNNRHLRSHGKKWGTRNLLFFFS